MNELTKMYGIFRRNRNLYGKTKNMGLMESRLEGYTEYSFCIQWDLTHVRLWHLPDAQRILEDHKRDKKFIGKYELIIMRAFSKSSKMDWEWLRTDKFTTLNALWKQKRYENNNQKSI
jgi:hypothetical protein